MPHHRRLTQGNKRLLFKKSMPWWDIPPPPPPSMDQLLLFNLENYSVSPTGPGRWEVKAKPPQPPRAVPERLSTKQAGELLRMHERTVRLEIQMGRLPAGRKGLAPTSPLVVLRKDVLEYLRKREARRTGD